MTHRQIPLKPVLWTLGSALALSLATLVGCSASATNSGETGNQAALGRSGDACTSSEECGTYLICNRNVCEQPVLDDMAPQTPGALTGFVLRKHVNGDSQYELVPGARVTVLRRDEVNPSAEIPEAASYTELSVTATTNQYGQYFFVDLPDGNYIVRATSNGVSGESPEVPVSYHLADAVILER